ncbi:hypothetical protein K443DRAFT_680913 [Laccaria amethystina LaAM-08-1]|uniref:Proline dehydrogenase n=1 Tax=Laccaria amethystina LaAM-08-1 TaxID=1095629 RepID=A0A0C9WML1_9AGAR|nr:hypothetical protein K443DRAFT_680913 [Laccaria amethystina LaAM-08-1]
MPIYHRRILTAFALSSPFYLFLNSNSNHDDPLRPPISALLRSYMVYSMCSIPALVDASPRIIDALNAVPGLRQAAHAFVRVTFFNQFVGGDTAVGTLPILRALRNANKGVLLNYAVEVDETHPTTSSHQHIADEIITAIDAAADFEDSLQPDLRLTTDPQMGRRTWVAVKMTALLPNAHALINLSEYITNARLRLQKDAPEAGIPFPGCPRLGDLDVVLSPSPGVGLEPEDVRELKELHDDLIRICTRAEERGVRVLIDAEYSWYQPAIDALTLSLMRRFNAIDREKTSPQQPLVYSTFQAYLRRTPAHVKLALADARKHNYALGVKLVRGAYHPCEVDAFYKKKSNGSTLSGKQPIPFESKSTSFEIKTESKPKRFRSLSISPDLEPPVWTEKKETDDAYNECVRVLVKAVREDISRSQAGARGIEGKGWLKSLWPWDPKPSTKRANIGVLFGTHNWDSCRLVLDELVDAGLATRREGGRAASLEEEVVDRVAVAQLYGMCDDLTDWIVRRTDSKTPFVVKYVPYGALAEVMPYLSRRATENKSVLGEGAALKEKERAGREIWKQVTFGRGS